jgi:predicted deacylase
MRDVPCITVDRFDPEAMGPGKHLRQLVLPGSEEVTLPVLLINGCRPGRTLVVLAGVHGDEFEGIRALHEVYARLMCERLWGRLLAVPIANPPAVQAGCRTSPWDGQNLARAFPGKQRGTVTERIAWALGEAIIARADLLLDLHSGGIAYEFPPLVGYDGSPTEQGRASRDAALAFGAPVLWAHPTIASGRSISEAARRQIPWLYAEAPGGGRINPRALRLYVRGVLNLLVHLQILPGTLRSRPPRWHLIGEGDVDRAIPSPASGFFVPRVRVLDRVRSGQTLGLVRDPFGRTIATVQAPQEGRVVMLRALPVVAADEPLALLARDM